MPAVQSPLQSITLRRKMGQSQLELLSRLPEGLAIWNPTTMIIILRERSRNHVVGRPTASPRTHTFITGEPMKSCTDQFLGFPYFASAVSLLTRDSPPLDRQEPQSFQRSAWPKRSNVTAPEPSSWPNSSSAICKSAFAPSPMRCAPSECTAWVE